MRLLPVVAALGLAVGLAQAEEPGAMLRGLEGWTASPLLTIGDEVAGHRPPGIPDGIGAFAIDDETVRVFVNHELWRDAGRAYEIGDMEVVGARISAFDLDRVTREIRAAGIAYARVRDHDGLLATTSAQLSEQPDMPGMGFSRFCSGQGVQAGTYGLRDDIYFASEEVKQGAHPHGGSVWALDVGTRDLWAVPAMGRGVWENVAALETGDPSRVAFLLADDIGGAPLMLYVGEKGAAASGFLARNGLAHGGLYAWIADDGALTPDDFAGAGAQRAGRFVPVPASDGARQRRMRAKALGAFRFSRPEDVATDPRDGSRAVLASTGGGAFDTDRWGTTYIVDVDFTADWSAIPATLTILYDGDETADHGLRNPDNLDWGDDGIITVQEDRAEKGGPFGRTSGREASIWQLDPQTGAALRIAEMNRAAVPDDPKADDIGNWESSGVLDVTALFATAPGETLLLATVQAHSLREGLIAEHDLVQGGQVVWLSRR
jgi:2',3'-cyclic-nucleotide 2'-phosphodiesterase / 3'-nucleotidase / 5'-nucleotidase